MILEKGHIEKISPESKAGEELWLVPLHTKGFHESSQLKYALHVAPLFAIGIMKGCIRSSRAPSPVSFILENILASIEAFIRRFFQRPMGAYVKVMVKFNESRFGHYFFVPVVDEAVGTVRLPCELNCFALRSE